MKNLPFRIRTALLLSLLVFTTLLFTAGCHEILPPEETAAPGAVEEDAPVHLSPVPLSIHEDSYTLFIYMCGSNLESRSGSATKNIREMTEATLPPHTRIIIQTGGAKNWRDFDIPNDRLGRYEIKDGQLKQIELLPEASMGRSDTLSSFLLWGLNYYPAQRYGLILWDHGGGSMKGVCYDENFGKDSLSLEGIAEAVSKFAIRARGRLDLLGFDACLMATYDTVAMASTYAHHLIASEENEPTGGWDYRVLAEHIGERDFYTRILTGYAEKCERAQKEIYTLSHVNLDYYDWLSDAFRDFTESLQKTPLPTVVKAAKKAHGYGVGLDGSSHYIDLGMLAANLKEVALQTAISNCTTAVNGEYRAGSSGISLFFPVDDVGMVNEYLEVFGKGGYADFLRANYTDIGQNLIHIEDVRDVDGRVQITVDKSSVKYISESVYYLLKIENVNDGFETRVYGLGKDRDYLHDDTQYTVNFRGRWVKFGGAYIYTDIIADTNSYTEFVSPILVNGQRTELQFTYRKETRTVSIQGYLSTDESVSRLTDLCEGDVITVLVCDQSEYEQQMIEGQTFTYSSDTPLEIHNLEPGIYQYTASFRDIFGQPCQVATAVIEYDGKSTRIIALTADHVSPEM